MKNFFLPKRTILLSPFPLLAKQHKRTRNIVYGHPSSWCLHYYFIFFIRLQHFILTSASFLKYLFEFPSPPFFRLLLNRSSSSVSRKKSLFSHLKFPPFFTKKLEAQGKNGNDWYILKCLLFIPLACHLLLIQIILHSWSSMRKFPASIRWLWLHLEIAMDEWLIQYFQYILWRKQLL